MKLLAPITTAALLPVLLLNSCVGNLADDAFAHAVKSGNARVAVANIQPGQARLHITERDGRTYYPIHYALCRGDAETAFALIRNGSPTTLDGQSLAYNAARINQPALARRFAAAGYGDSSDISRASAQARQDEHQSRQAVAAGTALGVMFLAALLSSSGGASSPSEEQQQRDDFTNGVISNNQQNYRDGLPPANSAYPGYGP